MLAHAYGDGWLFVVRLCEVATAYAQGAFHLTIRSRCCLHTTLLPVSFTMLLLLGNMNRHAASVRNVILRRRTFGHDGARCCETHAGVDVQGGATFSASSRTGYVLVLHGWTQLVECNGVQHVFSHSSSMYVYAWCFRSVSYLAAPLPIADIVLLPTFGTCLLLRTLFVCDLASEDAVRPVHQPNGTGEA